MSSISCTNIWPNFVLILASETSQIQIADLLEAQKLYILRIKHFFSFSEMKKFIQHTWFPHFSIFPKTSENLSFPDRKIIAKCRLNFNQTEVQSLTL